MTEIQNENIENLKELCLSKMLNRYRETLDTVKKQ